jgi:hypothetical protein
LNWGLFPAGKLKVGILIIFQIGQLEWGIFFLLGFGPRGIFPLGHLKVGIVSARDLKLGTFPLLFFTTDLTLEIR